MKTEFSRRELYALGEPIGNGSTRQKPGAKLGRLLLGGGGSGGGGGQVKYDNLDKLYDIQAKQGQQLMDMANENVYPAYKELMDDAKGAGSIANQEKAATSAGAQSAASTGQAKTQLSEQLSSLGVNPTDARYVNTFAKMDMDGAAQSAAAQTGARDRTQQLGFAKLKDVTSMGMGIGSDATSALNSAGGFASTSAQMQTNQMQMDQSARSNIASLAGRMMFADGGEVKAPSRFKVGGMARKNCYADGGEVEKPVELAGGGIVGAMSSIRPPAPPASAPARSTGSGFLSGASQSVIGANGIKGGRLIEGAGDLVGKVAPNAGNSISSFGKGLRLGEDARPAIDAYKSAADAAKASETVGIGQSSAPAAEALNAAHAESAMAGGQTGAEIAAATDASAVAATDAAATAAATDAAATAATSEGLAATAAAMGAGSAVAAALPWVGGALLVGSALGMFADGGSVNKKRLAVADGTRGGAVSGPGGPKDDLVPAMLSDEEYVLPVGTVKLYGKDHLEKMRQEGLAYEKKLGISKEAAWA